MDGFGGQLAVLHGLHGEVLAEAVQSPPAYTPGRLVRRFIDADALASRASCAASGSLRLASSKRWPMALKIASAASSKVSPVSSQAAVDQLGAHEAHAAHPARVIEQHFIGWAQVCRRT
jgi:hypothetical protein